MTRCPVRAATRPSGFGGNDTLEGLAGDDLWTAERGRIAPSMPLRQGINVQLAGDGNGRRFGGTDTLQSVANVVGTRVPIRSTRGFSAISTNSGA